MVSSLHTRADYQSRRSTRASSSKDVDADPDFKALTPRQQRQIDRVFDRATRTAKAPPRKKRRLTPSDAGGFEDDGEGGFMDAGGFDPDDGGGGGFVSDEGDGGFMPDEGGEGGFMPDEESGGESSKKNTEPVLPEDGEPRRIPIRKLPAILSSLNLPSDEDVLAVFRASASGWTEPNRYASKEEEEENRLMSGGVELKDFRAVCAALMGPDEAGSNDDEDAEEEDVYKGGGDESDLSEITEDEYEDLEEPAPKKTKGKGGGRGKKRVELEDNGKIKLNARQREVVNDLWGMMKPEAEQQKRGGHILGRDEVRRKVRDLGEMWTENEVSYSPQTIMGTDGRLLKWSLSFLPRYRVEG